MAVARAIAGWGRLATDITHLVVTTNSSAHAPGADLQLAMLLGLRPTVQRTLLYLHGCFGSCSALRVAKDLAKNNRGARVLVASSEVTTLLTFRAPDEDHLDALVAMALFGDGAGAAVIVAGDPTPVEHPIFPGNVARDRACLVYAARDKRHGARHICRGPCASP
jgi:predicted naringenin-chalcone synthase